MGLSIVVLLSWIALSDGDVAAEERETLREIASIGKQPLDADAILEVARAAWPADLQLCCEVVRHLAPEQRENFLRMAISMSIVDGALRAGENHILRLLADVLEIRPDRFRRLFADFSGKPLPDPSDLSDPRTWGGGGQRDQAGRSGAGGNRRESASGGSASSSERIRAFAVLGLEAGATQEDIRAAYRRLAAVHHPDRFSSLGPEAERAATATFQRIKAAFDQLSAA